ncbi:MAG: hypothetical protein ABW199_11615 [Caulobacterales bacterium]
MTRQYLVNSSLKEAVQAAARSLGGQVHLRAFTRSDLERLKQPVLVIADDSRLDLITPDVLQNMRRTSRGGMRYSPFLVFCSRKNDIPIWRHAGAIAVPAGADRATVKKAMEEALNGAKTWVTAQSYVGPCRRSHKAVLAWRNRRSSDRAEAQAKAEKAAEKRSQTELSNVRVSSLDIINRRLKLSVTLLAGSSIETRRAFRDLVVEAQASAQALRRGDLAGVIAQMRREADAFLQNSERSTAALERAIDDFSDGVARSL